MKASKTNTLTSAIVRKKMLLIGVVSLSLHAFAQCNQECLYNESTNNCEGSQGLTFCESKIDVSPTFRACHGDKPVRFECFSSQSYTTVTVTIYSGNGVCPSCQWTKVIEFVIDVRECYTNDTECSG